MPAPVDQRQHRLAEQFGPQRCAALGRNRGLQRGVEGGMVAQPHREAALQRGHRRLEGRQPGGIAGQHQHPAKVDREVERTIRAGPDFLDHSQQVRLACRIRRPVIVHKGVDQLPADQRLLHQGAHGIGHLEPGLGIERPGAGQR